MLYRLRNLENTIELVNIDTLENLYLENNLAKDVNSFYIISNSILRLTSFQAILAIEKENARIELERLRNQGRTLENYFSSQIENITIEPSIHSFSSNYEYIWPLINSIKVPEKPEIGDKVLKIGDKVKIALGINDKDYRYGLGSIKIDSIGIITNISSSWNLNDIVNKKNINLGIKKVIIDFGNRNSYWQGFSDEVVLIKDNVEMKNNKQIVNYPNINFENNILGKIRIFRNVESGKTIYGYNFSNKRILKYVDNCIKNDNKLYFKYSLINNNDYLENKCQYTKEEELYETEELIAKLCLAKVVNYIESGDLFGYKPTKKLMLGTYNKIEMIDYNYSNEGKVIPILSIFNNKLNKSIKFLLSDIELIVPNPTNWLKSYVEPKNRIIEIDSNVRVVNDKYGSVIKGEKLKVIDIDKNKYKLNIKYKDITESHLMRRAREERERILGIRDIYNTKSIKTKFNPNCPVICLNEKGERVKVKLKQIKVI